MAEGDAAVDHQRLDLMEHRRVAQGVVVAVDAAEAEHAHRRLALEQRADLDRRGVGAQQPPVAQVEGVLLVARRMIVGEVERAEVVVVGLDLGAFGDAVAHRSEDALDLLVDQRDRMERAGRPAPPGQGDVDRGARERRLALLFAEPAIDRLERRLHLLAQLVNALAEVAALGGVDLLELRLQRAHDAALAPHPLDAQRFPGGAVAGRGGLAPEAGEQIRELCVGRVAGGGSLLDRHQRLLARSVSAARRRLTRIPVGACCRATQSRLGWRLPARARTWPGRPARRTPARRAPRCRPASCDRARCRPPSSRR